MADFLPPEILREILLRLPVETLVRFTCVCKQWHSLITSSHFITAHLSHHQLPLSGSTLLFLRRFTDEPRKQTFSLHLNSSQTPHDSLPVYKNTIFNSPFRTCANLFFRIVGCLDGVVCLSDDLFGHTGRIILWNPSIKRFVLLPQPRVVFDVVGPYMFVLGFGFDLKTNDYKVIRLAYIQGNKIADEIPPRVEIYSLKVGSWREIKATGVLYLICELTWKQCYINGCVHWIAYEKKLGSICNLILLFDVREERFKKMKLPESLTKVMAMRVHIVEISGCVGVLVYDHGHCNVWIRKEYKSASSWTMMYSVDWDVGGGVLGLRANGQLLVVRDDGNLASYNVFNGESIDLGIHGFPEGFYAKTFTESLVLLDKESRSASYGGVKKKKGEEKKEDISQRYTDSALEKKEDLSFLLVSEEAGTAHENAVSARTSVDMYRTIHLSYQMAKFERLLSED